ncbi:MAG: small multi-drug export protein [Planctomycetia bacterium]
MAALSPTPADGSETRSVWLLLALFVGITALALGVWLWRSESENLHWIWLQMVGIASFPGKYVIFSGLSESSPMGPIGLALLCIAVDVIVASVLCLFLGPLGRLPKLGPALRRAHDGAQVMLAEYKKLARMAFLGVALFVFLPLPGTGAVGGVFAGQIVGLSRPRTVLAVGVGTGLQAALFATLALTLGASSEAILHNPMITILSALGLVIFLYAGWRLAKNQLR